MRRIDRIDGELLGVDERPRSTGPAVTPPALRHNLRHRAGQRRGVAAGSDGAARARLGRYEPCAAPDCSNATVRPAGPNTNAPSTWPRATSVRCPPADPACRWSTLAADAEARGWIDEADRHRRLIARLDAVLAQAVNTRPNPRWFASNAPALNYSKHTSKSPSPPSPSSPGSAGPPSTAIPSCAVIDEG